jgi:hypothetical protein
MPLFHIATNNQATRIRAGGFDLEKHLQRLVEANLEEIFGGTVGRYRVHCAW